MLWHIRDVLEPGRWMNMHIGDPSLRQQLAQGSASMGRWINRMDFAILADQFLNLQCLGSQPRTPIQDDLPRLYIQVRNDRRRGGILYLRDSTTRPIPQHCTIGISYDKAIRL